MNSHSRDALVVIPTYNEVENIRSAVSGVLSSSCRVDVLIVDDGSPDGTGQIADELAAGSDRVYVIHRTGKLGLGSAYISGFEYGLSRHYEYFVEMDADGSHPSSVIPTLISRLSSGSLAGVGVVIGSRWVAGGNVVDWPKHREFLSRTANTYTKIALRLPVQDATGGFRAYSRQSLEEIDIRSVHAHGYIFQVGMTMLVHDAGLSVIEVPITFTERRFGRSKMSTKIVLEAMAFVTIWGLSRRIKRRSQRKVSVTRGN